MRVDQTLSEPLCPSSGRASESSRVQAGYGSFQQAGTGGWDQVSLSSVAGRISQTMDTLSQQGVQQVLRLRRDYQAGRYQPSAQDISHALLQTAGV